MDKAEIRRLVKAQKRLLSQEDKLEAAAKVFDTLQQLDEFERADDVLLYHSLPDELSTIRFLDHWQGRKRLYLPRVSGDNLDILPYDKAGLRLGAFNIEEPNGHDLVSIDKIDLVVVPAVAYDIHGNRVGRGKGYYDRLLADCNAVKVGVAYDFQLVEHIDAEPHDVKVDIVITDNRTIIPRCQK